ncbi:MAG TPA: branched-chain amino acid ABC transporter permease, partial [Thermodesulfobacteriota bacterium]|nr:branched-chain amino acid ABC transporter permease [Thermodesulfobacteriota bacterium]
MNSTITKRVIAAAAVGLILLIIPLLLPEYPLHLLNISGIWIILALSLGLLQGYVGEISMGHAAFYGIGAYTSALLTMKAGVSFWISLPLSALVTMCFGYLIGLVSLRLRGPYFAICTLGFGEILRIVFVNWREMSGGPDGFTGIASPGAISLPGLGPLTFTGKQANYLLIYALVLITLGVMFRLVRSRPGRAFMAVREDPEYAESIGINVMKYKRLAFVVSTFFAGIGGCLYAHYEHFISPYSFTTGQSFDLVIMVIVGGMGTLMGPIIGAILLTFIPELLHSIKDYRMVIYGLMLML